VSESGKHGLQSRVMVSGKDEWKRGKERNIPVLQLLVVKSD